MTDYPTDDPYDDGVGVMIQPEYECTGDCGRVWTGQVGWWVSQINAIIPSHRSIRSATCPDCYQAEEEP
jgi:hypothetical protein